MRELDITLHGSRSAVIGYGRIGRLLTQRLISLGSEVTAIARSPEALASAYADGADTAHIRTLCSSMSGADVIFNTVPALMLDGEALGVIGKNTLVIDLASAPGGVDKSEAKRLGVRVIWALSLPGKHCPRTAAEIICEAVSERFDRTRNR